MVISNNSLDFHMENVIRTELVYKREYSYCTKFGWSLQNYLQQSLLFNQVLKVKWERGGESIVTFNNGKTFISL